MNELIEITEKDGKERRSTSIFEGIYKKQIIYSVIKKLYLNLLLLSNILFRLGMFCP